jgi:YHS domain-containing protein
MKVVCPVCNRLFEAECTPYKHTHENGITYYFDTEICQLQFYQSPDRFIYNCKREKEENES